MSNAFQCDRCGVLCAGMGEAGFRTPGIMGIMPYFNIRRGNYSEVEMCKACSKAMGDAWIYDGEGDGARST